MPLPIVSSSFHERYLLASVKRIEISGLRKGEGGSMGGPTIQ